MDSSSNEMATYRKVFPNFPALKQYQRLPDFSSRNRLHHFNVGVTPQNTMDYLSSYVIVWLCRVPPYDGDIKVLYSVSILNADGDKCCTEEIPTEFQQDYDWRPVTGGTYVINRAYLIDRQNGLLPNNQLTIVCEVEILNQELVEIKSGNQYIVKQDRKSAKINHKGTEYLNYSSLLSNSKYSDVHFLIDGKQFKLHKAILAVQSPAFAAMFDRKLTSENASKDQQIRKCNWIIANFASQRNTLVKNIPLGQNTNCEFQLKLSPALPRDNDNDCTLLAFWVISNKAPKFCFVINYKIAILNKLVRNWQTQTGQIEYNPTFGIASYPELNIDRANLLDSTNGILSSAGELVINCEVVFYHKKDQNLTKNETNLNQIEISDVRVEVFEEFINFIYTGKLTSLENFAHELFVASDKYQINSLKSRCELHLSKNLNIEYVIETLILADKHQASVLKAKSLGFIVANAKEVKSARNGLKLLKTRPDLMLEVLDLLSDK